MYDARQLDWHKRRKRVTYAGVAVFRLEAGRLTEGWVLGDIRGLMQQLTGDPAYLEARQPT